MRDPEQPPVVEPKPFAIDGAVPELAVTPTGYAALGVEHLIVLLERMTRWSIERLVRAR